MHIREAQESDREAIRRVHWAAFDEDEREIVANVAVEMLAEETKPSVLSLVAESDGTVVGHIAFSPVTTKDKDRFLGYLLGPLAVMPDCQKRGIGSQLIETGMAEVRKTAADVLLVYGNPKYYGRFGFHADAAQRYVPPYEIQFAFGWQGIALTESNIEQPPVTIECVACLRDPALW
ncbi:MAG: N-acetyltransferase [Pirellulales bacterium]|nr:N-acetyltransferase [Pirellulales bacterium]